MTRKNGTIVTESRIVGIQFSILSPEEIRNGSVAEITSRDTYINNKPVIGGLFDPRMGVLEPGVMCPTDGLDYIRCPGYFGHINLAKPVFYIQYLNTILKLLRVVCIKCSKLLIDKKQHTHLSSLPSEKRWNAVYALASKVKRCGECIDDGCGCKQPSKFKKEGLATVFAEWDNIEGINAEDASSLSMKMTPEIVIKLFRRISDDDVSFMGFNPIWSRPDWMICQVLAVPPPAVRPSVKHDAQQRSEDDLSHILVNIIKANRTLHDKMDQNAAPNVIDDWSTVLQYYIATMIDNKIPGVAAVAQRSGRALKSLKDRINGKGGRVRGNLMGKRVDFSARSVITPDPNLSIRELGVPLKIAKNITKPVKVNKLNKHILTQLTRNGPDKYPGAKLLEKRNGDTISLRYVDRDSIHLEEGDTVHRHMLNGDIVLFNRQPTLHRMSMMAHIVHVLFTGNTFRINVGVTVPYNADFDGDEMNLHMPQDAMSESELRNLAAVQHQIISPAENQSIVGVFQDSLLGIYQLTRPNISLNPQEAMNLLVKLTNIDVSIFSKQQKVSNFDVLSQMLPPISIHHKNKAFKDGEDRKTSNNIIEIKNGKWIRGQIDSGSLGAKSNGLIQRIFNDFSPRAASDFIDNIQYIANQYMTMCSFSVGISDLIANQETNDKIAQVIYTKKQDVKNLIDQTHLGIFENNTGKTNQEEFETQVNNILGGANQEAGKIGKASLDKKNRFVIMATAGSKGKDLNISQMISCLGQQQVDGKRIPYGFEHRTLPHFTKFDDSPRARGFVESSFIEGLTPDEVFFHAMGGRVGLIDTAVKTSQTGYIQRRLIKGLEDLISLYDGTVRNNKSKIIQFSYGNDNIDPIKIEKQYLPICELSVEQIYSHYNMNMNTEEVGVLNIGFTKETDKRHRAQLARCKQKSKDYIEYILQSRNKLITNIFNQTTSTTVYAPVAFTHIIANIQNQEHIDINSLVDITPLELFDLSEQYYTQLETLGRYGPTELFKILYKYYLSPKSLLIVKHFNRRAIILLLETIQLHYKQSIISPGEMVGIIAAQSIGQPTTQMTLNTFHFAGVASKSNVTRGVPRIEEILSLSENPKNPSITVYLKEYEQTDKNKAKEVMTKLEHTKLIDIAKSSEICFDPSDANTLIPEDKTILEQFGMFEELMVECTGEEKQSETSKWIVRIELDRESMLEKNIDMDDVNFAIKNNNSDISCIYSDYNSDNLVFRLRQSNLLSNKKKIKLKPVDQTDEIYLLKNFQNQLLNDVILRGVPRIGRVIMRSIKNYVSESNDEYKKNDIWVLDTVGTNLLDVLALDYIDTQRTFSNDIQETFKVLGIEAARNSIYTELTDVIEFDDTYVNYHHLGLLCDRMTCNVKMVSIFRHGINSDDIGPIAKASFEETPEMFLKAARHAEIDPVRGVSANIMCGQEGYFGTNLFGVVLDSEKMEKMPPIEPEEDKSIDEMFGHIADPDDPCSINNITIRNNVVNIHPSHNPDDDGYNIDF